MNGPSRVWDEVYVVGGSDMSHPSDCSVYFVDFDGEGVLIDSGAGAGIYQVVRNVELVGGDPSRISTLVLTHCHVDHVGGARYLKERFGTKIVMHSLDAGPVEQGDTRMTAAFWYGMDLQPLEVDVRLDGEESRLAFGGYTLTCLHTPGHTPGSLSVYFDSGGKRVLFGQDIHGPFLADLGADMGMWRRSMEKLLSLRADVLCEGHFGVYEPGSRVEAYIRHHLSINQAE